MASAYVPREVTTDEGPPVSFGEESMRCVVAAVSCVIVRCYHCFYALNMVEDSFVGSLRVTLPQDVVIDEESGGVADDQGIFMIGDVFGTFQ